MDRQDETGTQAAITGDVGANLVAVLVILLVAAGLTGVVSPATREERLIRAVQAAPLSGQDQSDVLYQRLRPGAGVMVVELTRSGAFAAEGGRMVPVADIARPWPPVAAVFVFSGAHYGTFRDQARAEALRLIEVTVPQALRRQEEVAGISAFSPAFLEIRAGAEPASIRPPLLRLLQAGPAAAGMGQSEEAAPGTSGLAQIAAWLRLGVNLFLMGIGLALLLGLRRRIR